MNLINTDVNIQEMYKYQLEKLDKEDYQEYLKYLEIFFMKEHKKDKYSKKIVEGKYILVDKQNPSKEIIISPSKFINMHKLYIELKEYSDTLLFKISSLIESKTNITEENRKDFDNLKKKYISCQEKIKDINNINSVFYDELVELLSKKIEKSNELSKFYMKRTMEYSKIEHMIPEKIKSKLILIFKENNKKIPSLTEINKIAKDNEIPSIEIEKWFAWIETVYLYKLIRSELNALNKLIIDKENIYDINTKYMIIKKPILEK